MSSIKIYNHSTSPNPTVPSLNLLILHNRLLIPDIFQYWLISLSLILIIRTIIRQILTEYRSVKPHQHERDVSDGSEGCRETWKVTLTGIEYAE